MNNCGIATRNRVSDIKCSLSVPAGWCWSFSRRAVFLHCPVRWKTRQRKDKEKGETKKRTFFDCLVLLFILLCARSYKKQRNWRGISVLRFQCWSELTTSTTECISATWENYYLFCPYRPKTLILSVRDIQAGYQKQNTSLPQAAFGEIPRIFHCKSRRLLVSDSY